MNGFLDMRQFFNVSVHVWSYYSNRYCFLCKEWEGRGVKTKQQIADTVCTAVQSVIVWKTCNRFVRDNVEGQRL